MVSSTYNPACYLPQSWASYLPNAISCPPPPTYSQTLYNYAISPFSSTYTTLRTMMDAVIGLPMLSFLLIPTMSSWSTSLNLLFFYLTWSTLVLSHPPLRVEIVATLAVRVLFYIAPSLFFLGFDVLVPSAAENLKALGDSALPFKNANRKRTLALLRMVGWSIFNILMGVVIQALVELLFTRVLVWRSALRVTTALPLPWGILKDLAKGYLLRETIAYVLHRYMLHEWHQNNSLSRAHGDWYHALAGISTPFPLSATYDHPAAYLVRSFLPTYIPAVLFRFHLLTYIFYLTLISLEETFAYSGYSTMPTNFILGGMARRTDHHLLCGGEGNFGPWGLCDWIMGTSVGADVIDDVVAEADKHDVPERMEKMKDRAKKRVNGKIGEAKGGVRRRTRNRSED
ncbi:uncharacterized protein Z520_02315 [Fonsecaea multimorphosa CBS 102226]|uniref:Fatty acid hydroxylase domain-containing protein n=1 Tax=Fonsecaea multimorphosa CBS 102226 TaxID=1442371 RepID=A0A0D2IYP7_9EURO|nr:uncharacterized protein Z520_02315 [Fonsecaea multimorphosa CBS 102226]KIY02177.1 hypothetical protein Z520_02315 [Fonsecaea multimorphosa CBS 102226]OAL29370.1 hypothetical protein AYO22_02264 [Fonsecaea multimorphosa]